MIGNLLFKTFYILSVALGRTTFSVKTDFTFEMRKASTQGRMGVLDARERGSRCFSIGIWSHIGYAEEQYLEIIANGPLLGYIVTF